MSHTYVSASDRDTRRVSERTALLHTGHLLLALTSIVSILVLALTVSAVHYRRASDVVNLNTVSSAKELEPPLEHLFAHAADRSFAAQGLFNFILSIRNAGGSLPNAGAIARATANAEAIDNASVSEYRERLVAARRHAAETNRPAPSVLPLFTATDLATLKPAIVVRTNETFGNELLFWS